MLPFIIRRMAIAVVVLIVSTFLMFVCVAKTGNPLATLQTRQPPPPPATINALRHQLHLDKPIPVRYGYWLRDVLHGNFGRDPFNNPVRPQLTAALGVTARLVIVATLLAAVIAVISGVLSAVKQYSITDYSITLIGFLFISLPTFWFAGLLKDLAVRINEGAGSQIFSTQGEQTPGYSGGFFGDLSDRTSHMILPVLSLALLSYAAFSRFQRAAMLDVLGADYMRLARAKGVPWRRVLIRHGLRTALIPTVTVVALGFGAILGGAVVTETIFNWNGMGLYLLKTLRTTDTSGTLAWLFVAALAVVLFNLLADILYAALDPRIRLS